MSNLNSINVVVESHQDTQLSTGNVLPLLNEIRHAIENLLDNNTTTTIDLCSIPMGPGEEQQIENMLGVGEVTGQLRTLGTSDFYESIFPGVWLIVHYNSGKEIMGKLIEITWMPSILQAQTEDVRHGLIKLIKQLDSTHT